MIAAATVAPPSPPAPLRSSSSASSSTTVRGASTTRRKSSTTSHRFSPLASSSRPGAPGTTPLSSIQLITNTIASSHPTSTNSAKKNKLICAPASASTADMTAALCAAESAAQALITAFEQMETARSSGGLSRQKQRQRRRRGRQGSPTAQPQSCRTTPKPSSSGTASIAPAHRLPQTLLAETTRPSLPWSCPACMATTMRTWTATLTTCTARAAKRTPRSYFQEHIDEIWSFCENLPSRNLVAAPSGPGGDVIFASGQSARSGSLGCSPGHRRLRYRPLKATKHRRRHDPGLRADQRSLPPGRPQREQHHPSVPLPTSVSRCMPQQARKTGPTSCSAWTSPFRSYPGRPQEERRAVGPRLHSTRLPDDRCDRSRPAGRHSQLERDIQSIRESTRVSRHAKFPTAPPKRPLRERVLNHAFSAFLTASVEGLQDQ
ncbi:hypothetical protein V8E36_001107 [Tilletia maclaganii]